MRGHHDGTHPRRAHGARHRQHQRHRAWHRAALRPGRREGDAERLRPPEEIARRAPRSAPRWAWREAPYSDADLSQRRSGAAMVQAAEAALGSVDILVNNAGIQYVAPVDEFPEAKWDAIIAINFSSNFHAIKAALPGMKRARAGGASSTSPRRTAWWPRPSRRPMSSAKHARGRADQDGGDRDRADAHHLQRHLPRLRPHPARRGAGASRSPRSTASPRRWRSTDLLLEHAALQALGRGGGGGAHGALPLPAPAAAR